MKRILCILILGVVGIAFSQTPYLERKISLKLQNESVESSLNKIAAAAGFIFSYNPAILDGRKELTYNFVDRSVRQILDEIFEGSVQYKARGKYIILTAAEKVSSKREPAVVSGYVVDESTGERLKDVSVYDPITLSSAVTDSYGYFEIKIDRPPSEIILSVNREHYVDTTLTVSNDRRLVNVPIRVNKEKLAVLADSVNQKLKRFWDRQERWFHNINLRNIDDSLHRRFQASFVPYVGTNHKLSGHVVNDYSLNVVGGYSLGVRRVEVGGVFNVVRGDVQGAQMAGVMNLVNGRTTGFQAAGVLNANRRGIDGFQAAGVLNLNTDDSRGFSAGGVGNISLGAVSPGQAGGVFNIASGGGAPVQLAGVLNISASDMKGFQAAGVFNVAARQMKGTQVAGAFNVGAGEVKGTQIAGVMNIARKVNGTQIGLINIADSVKGIPFGFLSIVGKGYHKIEVSADEIFYTNVAFRTGVRHFYNIFHAGAKPSTYGDPTTLWTFGYGLGTSQKLLRKLYLDVDLTSNQIVEGSSIEALNLLNKVYLGWDFQVLRKFSISAGATLNGLITENDYDAYPDLFTQYQPEIIADRDFGRNHNLRMWIGAKVGLRFF